METLSVEWAVWGSRRFYRNSPEDAAASPWLLLYVYILVDVSVVRENVLGCFGVEPEVRGRGHAGVGSGEDAREQLCVHDRNFCWSAETIFKKKKKKNGLF